MKHRWRWPKSTRTRLVCVNVYGRNRIPQATCQSSRVQALQKWIPSTPSFLWPKKKRKPLYRWTEKSKISNSWRATILRWTKILTNPKVNILNHKKLVFVSRCFSFSFWVYFRVNQQFIFQGVTNWTTKKPSYFPLCWLILIMVVNDNHRIIG